MCSVYSTTSVPDGRESVVWELTAGSALGELGTGL